MSSLLSFAVPAVTVGGVAALLSAVLAFKTLNASRRAASERRMKRERDAEEFRAAVERRHQELLRVKVRVQGGDGEWHTWVDSRASANPSSQIDLSEALESFTERIKSA